MSFEPITIYWSLPEKYRWDVTFGTTSSPTFHVPISYGITIEGTCEVVEESQKFLIEKDVEE